MALVKSFAREDDERRRFLGEVSRANEDVARGVGFDSGVSAGKQLATAAARLTVLPIGGHACSAATSRSARRWPFSATWPPCSARCRG